VGDSEHIVGEIRAIIAEIRREIPTGRFFEFGENLQLVEQINKFLTQIHKLMNALAGPYTSQSLDAIKLYSDAASILHAFQEYVQEVQAKGFGSKENTARIRNLISDLTGSISALSIDSPSQTIEPTDELKVEPTVFVSNNFPNIQPSVFISYAWGDEREVIVNEIDEALQKRGLRIIRDKRDLGYKGSIKAFMERIGQGRCIVVVISDKYLRSPNCMFELIEIAENREFHDRVFPVVLTDAAIYDPIKRVGYVKFWESKREELATALRSVDPANLQGLREDIDLYDRIRNEISGLTSILRDMNTLTPDMHRDSNFSQLYDAIEARLRE
jgi:hypothetical protein